MESNKAHSSLASLLPTGQSLSSISSQSSNKQQTLAKGTSTINYFQILKTKFNINKSISNHLQIVASRNINYKTETLPAYKIKRRKNIDRLSIGNGNYYGDRLYKL